MWVSHAHVVAITLGHCLVKSRRNPGQTLPQNTKNQSKNSRRSTQAILEKLFFCLSTLIPLKIGIPPIFDHCLSILGLLSCILFRGADWLFPSGTQLHTSCKRIFNTVSAFCNHLGFRCTPKVNNLRAAVKAEPQTGL